MLLPVRYVYKLYFGQPNSGCTAVLDFGHGGHASEPNRLVPCTGFPHPRRSSVDVCRETIKIGKQIRPIPGFAGEESDRLSSHAELLAEHRRSADNT